MTEPSQSCAPVAVLLVAGVGQRLRPLTNDRPKALVRVGPETIVDRSLRLLIAHGVREVVLATGYCEQAVRNALRDCPIPVHYRRNPDYESTQNSVSLLACADAVAGRPFYKLDGDLLFHPEVLRRLDSTSAGIAAAVDPSAQLGEEEMKVQLRPGTRSIASFGKGLDPNECWGESIGVERINQSAVAPLFKALQEAQSSGATNLYYEDVYSRLILGGIDSQAIDVSGLAWVEVDTPEDLAAAAQMVAGGGLGG